MDKILNLNEKFTGIKDSCDFNVSDMKKPVTFLKGHVKIVDDYSGETILDKDNLIVLRGRTFALEKIFGCVNTLNKGYNVTNIDDKTVCMFTCGTGGTVPNEPFHVIPTIPSDCRELGHAIPFRPYIPGEADPAGYHNLKTNTNGEDGYYAKEFEEITWKTNIPQGVDAELDDEVYVQLILRITEDDFKTIEMTDENGQKTYKRSTSISELGLIIANQDKTNTGKYSNYELFSRICFESEPLFNQSKSLTVFYSIYA